MTDKSVLMLWLSRTYRLNSTSASKHATVYGRSERAH